MFSFKAVLFKGLFSKFYVMCWEKCWRSKLLRGNVAKNIFVSLACICVLSACMWSAGYASNSRWAFCVTDGLVKHEGVVSINHVPPHQSAAAGHNMCTFLYTAHAPYTHTHMHKVHPWQYLGYINTEHPHRHLSLCKARWSTHTTHLSSTLLASICIVYGTRLNIPKQAMWGFHMLPVLMVSPQNCVENSLVAG